jgi:hypothetical protein
MPQHDTPSASVALSEGSPLVANASQKALAHVSPQVLLTVLLSTGQGIVLPPGSSWQAWIKQWAALQVHPLLDQLMVVDPCDTEYRMKTFKSMGLLPWCSPQVEMTSHTQQWAWVLRRLLNPSADSHHWILLLKEGEVLNDTMLPFLKHYLAQLSLHVSVVDIPMVYQGMWSLHAGGNRQGDAEGMSCSPVQWKPARCIRLSHLKSAHAWLTHGLILDTLGEVATRQSYEMFCESLRVVPLANRLPITKEALSLQGAVNPWGHVVCHTRQEALDYFCTHPQSETAFWVADCLKTLPVKASKEKINHHLKAYERYLKDYTGVPLDAFSEKPLQFMSRFIDKERYFWFQLLAQQRTHVTYRILDYLLTSSP